MSCLGAVVALRREAVALLPQVREQAPVSPGATTSAGGTASGGGIVSGGGTLAPDAEASGSYSDAKIDVEISGVGAKRATRAAQRLVERGATALLSWGLAGALSPDLSAGDLIVPRLVIDGTRDGPGDGTGYGTGDSARDATGRILPVDLVWRDRLLAKLAGPGGAEGRAPISDITLASSSTLLATPEQKQTFRERTGGAGAVDMESAAVAAVAAEANLPFLIVRAICDAANDAVPPAALVAMGPTGRLRPFSLVAALTRQPSQIPALIRLGRCERQALARLAEVVTRVGPGLVVS